jgi:ferric-dicitrate binding protein FerR (iron transport regulator)
MDKILLKKYLDNGCNMQELEIVLSWFRDTACTEKGKALLHGIWEDLAVDESESGADFDSILNSIHHHININQAKLLIENAENDLIKYNRRQRIITFMRNSAAILLLPVLSLGLFFSFKYFSARLLFKSDEQAYNEVISSVDAITRVTLPDGSNVWLNHSSSLRYPAVFSGKCRKVELKGEGYFEVLSNSGIPFIVDAGEIQIWARGTSFNVMAYPDEGKVETSLIKGSVEIQKLYMAENQFLSGEWIQLICNIL